MLQHVIRLQNAGRRQRHAIEIAAREFQVAVLAVRHQQRRLRVIQLAKHFDERLRLVRLERPGIHDRQLLLREFCRKRRAQCAQQHLLWQRIAVIARPWSVDRAAMTPERRPDRADAGASRTLLFPELATRATYFALFLAHVTRKVLVLPDARRERTAADAARRAMMHRTVRRVAAAVVPALDAALKP